MKNSFVKSIQTRKEYFTDNVLRWSQSNLRYFPRRENNNSWVLLVAEILLRRTTAKQVDKIFDMLIRAIPEPKSAAIIDTVELSAIIGNLGLIQRAEIIKNIGEILYKNYNNQVPESKNDLLAPTHVGHYTANALRCFSFKIRALVLVVNVVRVANKYMGLPITPRIQNKPYKNNDFVELLWTLTPLSDCDKFFWGVN